jgi:hypothetical protein
VESDKKGSEHCPKQIASIDFSTRKSNGFDVTEQEACRWARTSLKSHTAQQEAGR